MRRLLLTLVALFVGAVAQAQTPTPEQANTRVAELLNTADYVTLATELPAVREMVIKPLLALADALVAHYEGRFEDSNRAIEEVARYPEELGQGTVFGMSNYALINNLCIEDYAQGAEVTRQLLEALLDTAEAEASRRGLLSLQRWMQALAKREKVEVVRPQKDVLIPIERRPIGRGEHLIVKATVNGVSEDFIFDTGCSHANFISREVAERLGVEIVADSIITQGVGGSGYVQLGVLPEMRLGDVVIKNPTFLVAEHLIPEHAGVEGIFGVRHDDGFAEGAAGLVRRHRLVVHDGQLDAGGIRAAIRIGNGHAHRPAFAGGVFRVLMVVVQREGIVQLAGGGIVGRREHAGRTIVASADVEAGSLTVEQLDPLPLIIGNERQPDSRRLHLANPRLDALVRLCLLVRGKRIVNIHEQHVNAALL